MRIELYTKLRLESTLDEPEGVYEANYHKYAYLIGIAMIWASINHVVNC